MKLFKKRFQVKILYAINNLEMGPSEFENRESPKAPVKKVQSWATVVCRIQRKVIYLSWLLSILVSPSSVETHIVIIYESLESFLLHFFFPEARITTLFGKPADQEDRRLMSQNNHLLLHIFKMNFIGV